MRVAVLVSGGGTNLQALIDAKAAGKLPNAELALVVASKPGVYALERAAKDVYKRQSGKRATARTRTPPTR